MAPNRELYFLEGIRYLPKILELADRNRLNKTYGCFDRGYWHYRTSDFPSGMFQEAVLPLALAYTLKHPQNKFYQEERIKELALAGIEFARKSSHRDGSSDDYFPYERASGATAFSLYASTESCLRLNETKAEWLEFFKKRGRYLAGPGYEESGVLTNHKALIVLALYNVFLLTGDEFFRKKAGSRLKDLLLLQTSEGWFPEYGGCDPGYLTFTIDFLAKYYSKSKDERVLGPLERAIEFSSYFMHPDGSYGGEYGSRNTFHFVPHGFELMGKKFPKALWLANEFLKSVADEKRSYLEDDRIFCHYVYNFLQAYEDFAPRNAQSAPPEAQNFFQVFKEAGLVVKRSGGDYTVISPTKGGVAKLFKEGVLYWNDVALVGRSKDGRKFTSQQGRDFQWQITNGKLTVEGNCYEYRDLVFSPLSFLLFRAFLLAFGRFLPANVTRRLLQKKGIVGKRKKFPLRFKKVFDLEGNSAPEYFFVKEDPSVEIAELWIGSDPTFIYVATSQPYQPGALVPWVDLSPLLPELHQKQKADFKPAFQPALR